MKDDQTHLIAKQLLSQLKADQRSSSEIARLAHVSQPTVSRMRRSNGIRQRTSKSFNKLCNFYNLSYAESKTACRYNELLKEAIIDAWDGTEACGRSLLLIVKGLKALNHKANDTVGDSFDQV